MALALLVTQAEIMTINFLITNTPSSNLESVILAHLFQFKILSYTLLDIIKLA